MLQRQLRRPQTATFLECRCSLARNSRTSLSKQEGYSRQTPQLPPCPEGLLREMQKYPTAAYSLHLQHNKPGYHPSCSQWSSDRVRKPSQAVGSPSLQSVPTATHSPTVTGILTASASAFSLETLPPATTDSKAVTQRCLSGKLGASKYRVLPGQQVVCG